MRTASELAAAAAILPLFVSAASAQDPLELIKLAQGDWQGQLTYRDYSNNQRYSVDMTATVSVSPDGNRISRDIRFAEQGDKGFASDVITIADDDQTAIVVSFGGRSVSQSTYTIESFADLGDEGWRIIALGEGIDAGEPADVRLTTEYAIDRVIQTKDVRPKGNEAADWVFRNEIVLDRVVLDDASRLIGKWEVDLRPTPQAPPSIAPMVIESVDDGTLTGSFYGTPVESGIVNTLWGRASFAFVTSDGSGPYATFGTMQPDGSINGMTLSTGRDFLSVWTAKLADR